MASDKDKARIVSTAHQILFNDAPAQAVDFKTFVTSDKYMGVTNIYPFWMRELADFGPNISSLLLTGSLGGGKSTLANLALCYRLYLLFLHGDVARYFHMVPGSPISFLYFSVSMSIAKKSGFQQLRNFIDQSRWFKENYPRNKKVDSSILFSNNVSVDYASNEQHAIGRNVAGFILDEANFRKGVGEGVAEEYSEVSRLAQQLEDRQFSRFAEGGVLKSFSCYVSSASFSSSFIDTKKAEIEKDPHGKVITAVAYKITPEKYSGKTFEVFCGHGQLSPCIVQSSTHKKSLIAATKLPASMARKLFETPPLELKSQFQKNIYLAIQNHCGRSTAMRGTFITNYDIVRKSYDGSLPSPFLQDSIILSNLDDVRISSIIDWSRFESPDAPHSLYLDLSLTGDPGSLCCVRYDGTDKAGLKHHTHVFTLRLDPPEYPAMIRISKVEDFVLEFAEHVNLAAFGSDQFQSAMIRQNISSALSLPDIRLSLDSSDVPHLLWLAAMVDKRFRMRYYEDVDLEIREAVHDVKRHKVVKRDGTHDDQFQTLVGAFYLSDTVGSTAGSLDDLLGPSVNLVGKNAFSRMLDKMGMSSVLNRGAVRVYAEKKEGESKTTYRVESPMARREEFGRRRFSRFLDMMDAAEDEDMKLSDW